MRFLLSLIIALTSLASFAQNRQQDSIRTYEMEHIVIQENRLKTPFSEASRDIEIITAKDIRQSVAKSVSEILSYTPGVDIRQRGPVGVQSDIGIRGGSFEQTLILVNGIKMSDPQTGHHALNLPFNINNIQRIEVLKGPGARIFGQNAFSGAVNIITSIPDEKRIGLSAYAGGFGLYGLNFDIALPRGDFKQYISVARDASDGYRHNTDFTIDNVFYQAAIDNVAGGAVNIMAGYTDRKFGANGFYASPAFTEQYEEVKTGLISASYEIDNKVINNTARAYWRINNDDYMFVRGNPGVYRNDHTTQVFGIENNVSIQNSVGALGLGIEYRKEMIEGTWVRGEELSPSNLDGFGRDKVGLYAEHHFDIGKLDITPGLFVNYYSDFKWNFFPGIDLGYSLSSDLRIFANIGRTYRIPTFYDQYYQSPVEQGSPDLSPEEALGYETGIRYLRRGVNLELNAFVQDASQLIDWVQVPVTDSTFYWNARNINNITTRGLEFSSHFNLNELINPGFFIRNFFLSYNYLDVDKEELSDVTTRYTLDNLKHQLIFGIDHKILKNVYHNFRTRYIERVNQSPYWLLDAKIYYQHQELQVFAEVTNLTNSEYTEVMVPMPGRWFRVGVQYQFDL